MMMQAVLASKRPYQQDTDVADNHQQNIIGGVNMSFTFGACLLIIIIPIVAGLILFGLPKLKELFREQN